MMNINENSIKYYYIKIIPNFNKNEIKYWLDENDHKKDKKIQIKW